MTGIDESYAEEGQFPRKNFSAFSPARLRLAVASPFFCFPWWGIAGAAALYFAAESKNWDIF
jgi:hypothetical protein